MPLRNRLRGMLRLIRVDTLRRVHNVGFLMEWLILFMWIKVNLSGGITVKSIAK